MEKMDLRQTQLAAKDLLFRFDELCSSLGAKYYLMFGTLLGAIRHGGFIPWDDDIDIGMMPEDYKIIEDYFGKTEDPIMELHNAKTVKDCFYNISRVCDKEHYLVFQNRTYTSGLFIDIYLIEGMGNDVDLKYWEKQNKRIKRWRKSAFMSTNKSILYGANQINKILNIPHVIISKIFGKDYYFRKLNSHKYYDIKDSKYVGVPNWETVKYPKSIFEDTIRIKFEDIEVSVPKEYEQYLITEFGDWRQLPEESKRIPYHGYTAYIKDL